MIPPSSTCGKTDSLIAAQWIRMQDGATGMYKCFVVANMVLYCKQWDATVRFYRDCLKLPVLFSTDWFVEFGLTDNSRLSIADETRTSIKSCGGAGITITLQVMDIDAAWEQVARMNLNPTEVKQHPWNARVFYLFDPEEHRIEFWELCVSDNDNT